MGHGRIRVHVIPRAHADEIAGERDGAVLVRVTAPPADGRANAAVCAVIAAALKVAPGRVSVVRGARSRRKLVQVDGTDTGTLERVLRRRS